MAKCSICNDPQKNQFVAARHLEGHSASAMERMSKDKGFGMKRETIGRHLKTCIGATDVKPADVAKVAATVTPPDPKPGQTEGDVAVLVQKEVVKKLASGEARVTVQHGLQAQQLLDRRAERAKDRELAVTLARILHTTAPPPEAIRARPVEVIEGEVTHGD